VKGGLRRGAVEAVADSGPIRGVGGHFDGDPVETSLVQIVEDAVQAFRVCAGRGGHVGEVESHSPALPGRISQDDGSPRAVVAGMLAGRFRAAADAYGTDNRFDLRL